MTYQVLARKFGRPVNAVRHRRGKKRIRAKKDWRPEDDKILGTRTDYEIAVQQWGFADVGGEGEWSRD